MAETVPDVFKTLIYDMTRDLSLTFPEYAYLWESWTKEDVSELDVHGLYNYCAGVYPERFFDILYQNEEIFEPENETNTMFLPGVEFKLLFNVADITHKTRKALWKYLQLVLFTIVKNVKDKSKFGNSANLFGNMENMDLFEKINEAITGMSDFFSGEGESDEGADTTDAGLDEAFDEMGKTFEKFREQTESASTSGRPDLNPNTTFHFGEEERPDAADIHDHIKNLFSGKIGTLAQELAEEISGDIQRLLGDIGEINSIQDLLKHAMKNPDKIIAIIKTVSDKLQAKLSSGDISQEELLKEVGEVIGNMKKMDNMKGLFESMGAAADGSSSVSDIIQNLLKSLNGPGGAGSKGMGNLMRIIKKFMATMGKGGSGGMMDMMKGMLGEEGAQQMEQFKDMFEQMGQGDVPKGARIDTVAMERAAKQSSLKDRMRDRIIQKKLIQAQELAKEEAEKAERAKNYVPYDFSDEPTKSGKKGGNTKKPAVFKVEGDRQETSSVLAKPVASAASAEPAIENTIISNDPPQSSVDADDAAPVETKKDKKKKKKSKK